MVVPYLSVPTNLPDFASPMCCSCLNHSRKPTRQKLRIVLVKDTISPPPNWSVWSVGLIYIAYKLDLPLGSWQEMVGIKW